MTKLQQLEKEHNALKKDYDKAIAEGKLIFEHLGETYLVAYAKYRLEYMQTLINPEPKEPKRKR